MYLRKPSTTLGTVIFDLVAFRLRKDGICLCHNISVDYDAGSHLRFLYAEKATLHCQASDITDAFHDRYEKHYVTNYRPRKSNDMYASFKKMTINTIYMVTGIINRIKAIVFNIRHIHFQH